MSLAGFSPAKPYVFAASKIRRIGGVAGGIRLGSRRRVTLVIWFAMAHALLWTMILAKLKAAQDIHFDTAEAYAWGQKFQLGYGKHPPLSGWIAGRGSICSRRPTLPPTGWRWRPSASGW